ncbi:hypothetical protein GCM10022270_26610 [Terriglobus aquaticus]
MQITGGTVVGMLKMAGAFSSQVRQLSGPMTFKVMIHGNRMVRAGLHTTQIIDLDRQTITMVDHDKRSYSVVTFQQMEQQMAKVVSQAKGTTAAGSTGDQVAFNAHITSNGTTRQVDGRSAAESLLTVTFTQPDASKSAMAATSEIWSVADCPGLSELRAFRERLSKELSVQIESASMASLLSSQPGGAQALAELQKESAKMTGFPVLQVTRVGFTANGEPLPPPSAVPLAHNENQGSSEAASIAKETATATATQTASDQMSKLGTFGRALSGATMGSLLHHTQKASPAAGKSGSGTADAAAAVLMEAQTQASSFSVAPVELSGFDVPTGYKAVSSPLNSR